MRMSEKRLEITEEILDRVVYGMENQKERLFLNPADGAVKTIEGSGLAPAGFIPMPPWGPTEGFRLMDGFVGTLSDEVYRSRLQHILHSGSGVFRRFKDALKERPEIESLWFRFKKREMRRIALAWLSRWSEALALESLEAEPEDWEELTLTDFVFRPGRTDDLDAVCAWITDAERESVPGLTPEERIRFSFRGRAGTAEESSASASAEGSAEAPLPEDLCVAESPSGDIVGFSWFTVSENGADADGRLLQVCVRPGYRGLGIGRKLTESAFEEVLQRGARSLSFRTGGDELLAGFLERKGFERVAVFWRKEAGSD